MLKDFSSGWGVASSVIGLDGSESMGGASGGTVSAGSTCTGGSSDAGVVSLAEEVIFFSPDGSVSIRPGRSASSCVTTSEGFAFPFCAAAALETSADVVCGGSSPAVFADTPVPPQPTRSSTLSIPAMICSFFILYLQFLFFRPVPVHNTTTTGSPTSQRKSAQLP